VSHALSIKSFLTLVFFIHLTRSNQLEANEYQRGQELARLLTRLGPTFIKVGQSLSIRTDLLSVGYQRGLATLQDQVPAFSTQQATDILERAWGRRVTDVFQEPLSKDGPVAAASLGQVYRCVLRGTGQPVAVKVQRPDIGNQIALDMHLLREVAPVLKRAFNLNTDTVGTVDAWGTGFVDELDYLQEAENAEVFIESIAGTPLKDVVFAPGVVNEWTTRNVLVTEWVDGERLDRSENKDVTVLCSIAMNTYLTMLLELGLLHCDPHPGNLLRTGDGKLCILDWGMVTRLDPGLQLTLIEHVAHLTSGDYAEIPRDLLLLGFIPEGKADQIEDSGVVELLADIYSSWTKGGGAAAINVNDVVNRLQDLTAEKGNLFQIPPYFAYIAKSFSVLEGIGLSNDPKYSIINECLPYVSKRLLTDKDTMGPALSTFVFGPAKHDIAHRIVDYKRVEQLVEGFGNYTTSASGALLGQGSLSRTQLLESAADQLLDLVFTEEETPLQEIVLEQMAKIVASSSRSIFTEIRERSGVLPSGRTVLGTALDPLGLWRTSPLVRVNDLDKRTVEMTRKLISLLQRQVVESGSSVLDLSTLSRQEILDLSSILVRKVWDRRRGLVRTGGRFARQLLQLTADKLERGERDTRRLPDRQTTPEDSPAEGQNPELPLLSSSIRDGVERTRRTIDELRPDSLPANPLVPKRSFESARLQQARRRLEALERDEIPEVIAASDDP
jgi:predicted unusual protein kinase regulating ubiquinone biosynthesis (AarF/ABC1/UbiB family)